MTGKEMTPGSESQVKPCPFCGDTLEANQYIPEYGIWCHCSASGDDMSKPTVEEWNNAWAHKQIASLTERVKELEHITQHWVTIDAFYHAKKVFDEKVSELQSQLDAANKRNEELKSQSEVFKEMANIKSSQIESLTRQLDKQGKFLDKCISYIGAWASFSNGEPNAKELLKEYDALESAAEIREAKP